MPIDEKHARRSDLADAQRLVEQGEFEAALDVLTDAQEGAAAEGDAEALDDIRRLARTVWRRAPRGSAHTERADRLVRGMMADVAVRPDLAGLAQLGTRPAAAPTADARALVYAGFGRRCAAFVLDNWIVLTALGLLLGATGPSGGAWILFLLVPFYFALFEGTASGQTPGKRMLGIAVRDERTGEPVGIGRALGRELFRAAMLFPLVFPFVLDGLFALSNESHKTWHDRVTRTVVVRLHPESARAGRPSYPTPGAV